MTAICVAGITLVIIPLLALTANQLSHLQRAVQDYVAVSAYHLDDTSKKDLTEKIIPKINSFQYESSTSMLLLCSPQFIADNIAFRNALLWARDPQVFRLIVIDEAHLYAIHGVSFRDSIRQLKRDFFAQLYRNMDRYAPLLLATTATMPTTFLRAQSSLAYVNWELPCHQLRPSPTEFRQRYIEIELFVQGEVGSVGIDRLLLMLTTDDTSHGCIFAKFKSECTMWAAALEAKLADQLIDMDVLQINGDMDKNEKFSFVRPFTSAVTMKNYHPRMLIATPATNTGIDQVLIQYVLSVGLPRCLTTLIQERGRNRNDGMYVMLTDVGELLCHSNR